MTNVDADRASGWGRPQPLGMNGNGWNRPCHERQNQRATGVRTDGMSVHGDPTQHGKPRRCRVVPPNRTPARDRLGRLGVSERPVVPRKPGNCRWREGA